jgi:glycosyltransferase involved in cell wall biosynthesis
VSTEATSDISVVIPYYNREQCIDETIQSVLAQTLKPLEIILVNDCSRESSRRHLDRHAGVCTIVDLPVHVTAAATRNEGIRRARGQFIAFLDDDDLWLPHKLEVQRRYMAEHPRCDAVHSAAWAFYSDKPDKLIARDWPGPLTLAQALQPPNWVMLQTLLIRADVIRALGGCNPRFRSVADQDFKIRCVAAGYRMEAIPEPLACYRQQGQASMSKRHWQVFCWHLRLCWEHRALYYRVYGVRGIVFFVLLAVAIALKNVRYMGGGVRLLIRLSTLKWQVRRDYQEPIQL